MFKQNASKNDTVSILVILFVCGLLVLAIMDVNYRPIFSDLAKVCVGGYIGLLVPKQ
jgi:RsiW-degrading membrane proteinase PrsW (M82 family)